MMPRQPDFTECETREEFAAVRRRFNQITTCTCGPASDMQCPVCDGSYDDDDQEEA